MSDITPPSRKKGRPIGAKAFSPQELKETLDAIAEAKPRNAAEWDALAAKLSSKVCEMTSGKPRTARDIKKKFMRLVLRTVKPNPPPEAVRAAAIDKEMLFPVENEAISPGTDKTELSDEESVGSSDAAFSQRSPRMSNQEMLKRLIESDERHAKKDEEIVSVLHATVQALVNRPSADIPELSQSLKAVLEALTVQTKLAAAIAQSIVPKQ